jgi:hypothetical protein
MEPFYRLTKNLTPQTVGALVVIIALMAVIPLGLRLTQQSQSTQSQAAPDSAQVPGTSLSLIQHKFDCQVGDPANGIHPSTNCNDPLVSKIIAVDVLVHSDIDASNLIKTQLNFDPENLHVVKIITTGPKGNNNSVKSADDFFIEQWVSNNFKNDQGTVSLVGSVPDPGFTTSADKPAVMARVYFKALKSGSTTITFDQSSSIFRSADNQNILSSTQDLRLEIR